MTFKYDVGQGRVIRNGHDIGTISYEYLKFLHQRASTKEFFISLLENNDDAPHKL